VGLGKRQDLGRASRRTPVGLHEFAVPQLAPLGAAEHPHAVPPVCVALTAANIILIYSPIFEIFNISRVLSSNWPVVLLRSRTALSQSSRTAILWNRKVVRKERHAAPWITPGGSIAVTSGTTGVRPMPGPAPMAAVGVGWATAARERPTAARPPSCRPASPAYACSSSAVAAASACPAPRQAVAGIGVSF